VQTAERLAFTALIVVLLAFIGNLWMTMDKRQAQFEDRLATALATASDGVQKSTNAKLDALTGEVHNQLAPVTAQMAGLLKDVRSKVQAVDINSVNATVASLDQGLRNVNKQVEAVDVAGVNKSLQDLDTGLLALNAKVEAVDVAELNKQVAGVSPLVESLTATIKDVDGGVKQVTAVMPDFLDCQVTEDGVGNKSCLYARYADMTSDVDKVSSDVRRYVDTFTAPPTFWGKVKGIVETFALLGLKLGY
jgi:ABC-type transporter Mla MlaB component